MTEGRTERLFLADIVQAAREIAEYANVEEGVFLNDRMRQRAGIQCFEVIGEATKKLPTSLREAHPEVLDATWPRFAIN